MRGWIWMCVVVAGCGSLARTAADGCDIGMRDGELDGEFHGVLCEPRDDAAPFVRRYDGEATDGKTPPPGFQAAWEDCYVEAYNLAYDVHADGCDTRDTGW